MQPETGSEKYAKHLYTTGKRKETKEKEGALFVYFDTEAMQDGGKHVANLLCAEVDDHNEPIVFHGTDCVESFINGFEN